MAKAMLTTFDNPYDPFDNFDEWYRCDLDKKHDCCGMIDRLAYTSDALSDEENDRIVERAIDDIIKYDPLNIYRKIVRDE